MLKVVALEIVLLLEVAAFDGLCHFVRKPMNGQHASFPAKIGRRDGGRSVSFAFSLIACPSTPAKGRKASSIWVNFICWHQAFIILIKHSQLLEIQSEARWENRPDPYGMLWI